MAASDVNELAEIQGLLSELDPEALTLFQEAADGRDAKEFFQSTVGKYMVGCAQLEYQTAMRALRETHPWRRRRIQQLQNQAWRAEQFMGWLAELVRGGVMAEKALEQRDEQ